MKKTILALIIFACSFVPAFAATSSISEIEVGQVISFNGLKYAKTGEDPILGSQFMAICESATIIESTWLYPNGGTAASPANVTANSRYVMDNPWPGYKAKCQIQLFLKNMWGDVTNEGWDNLGGYGARAGQVNDTIVLQTGSKALHGGSGYGINLFGYTTEQTMTAKARIYCEKGGPLP